MKTWRISISMANLSTSIPLRASIAVIIDPIYDSYVHKLMKYFRDRDRFCEFKEADLKNYQSYFDIIQEFQKHFGLDSFTVKEIDKYLWQLGKEAFNKHK